MSSNYFVVIPSDDTDTGTETIVYEPDELSAALAVFFRHIEEGAEHAEIRWSA